MWVVPEVAIVNLSWNMPWGSLVKGLDYMSAEKSCPNTIAQMQGKPRRINQSLIESSRGEAQHNFCHCAWRASMSCG